MEKDLNLDSESDRLCKQIEIFEKHARDNFQEMDSQIENIECVWDGTIFWHLNFYKLLRFNILF